jgi:hypothetical protein
MPGSKRRGLEEAETAAAQRALMPPPAVAEPGASKRVLESRVDHAVPVAHAGDAAEPVTAVMHRHRAWRWQPCAVVAAAACPGGDLLAIGLETGDFELWDLAAMACVQVRHECFGGRLLPHEQPVYKPVLHFLQFADFHSLLAAGSLTDNNLAGALP